MATPPIDPISDPRLTHNTTTLNGRNYHYVLGEPKNGDIKGTIFLVHGWPDLWLGWRYQIPFLIDLGFRVVAHDLMGFGGTDAPHVPPESLNLYGFKRASDDIEALAKQLGVSSIILGGHDWGGAVVWRCALWKPDLISHVFAVCTPYTPPSNRYISTEDLAAIRPQFGYQLQLASSVVEEALNTPEQLRQFFSGIYGGKGLNGERGFAKETGVLLDNIAKIGKPRLLSDKELEYYVDQYSRNGMHGTLNWYRTRKVNFDEELALSNKRIDIPTLFIQANHDDVLTPDLSLGMENFMANLSRGEVNATHWALTQTPNEVNSIIKGWLDRVYFKTRSTL